MGVNAEFRSEEPRAPCTLIAQRCTDVVDAPIRRALIEKMSDIRSNPCATGVSGDSFRCCSDSCSELLRSSRHLGWSSLLLDHHAISAADAEYETVCTEDQALAVMTRGEFNLESFNDGMWRRAKYARGIVGLTPGGKVNRLRRKLAKDAEPAEMVKIYLPSSLMTLIARKSTEGQASKSQRRR